MTKGTPQRDFGSAPSYYDALVVLLLVIAAFFVTRDQLRRLPCTDGEQPTHVVDYKFGTQPRDPSMTLMLDGCSENTEGIFVPAHGQCRVDIRLTRKPTERARILLKVLRPDGVHNEIVIAGAGSAPATRWSDVFLTDEITLPVRTQSLPGPEVTVKTTNATDHPVRVIYQARYSTFGDASVCLANIPLLFAAWAAVVFSVAGLRRVRTEPRGRWTIVAISCAMIASALVVQSTPGFWLSLAVIALLIYALTKSTSIDVRRHVATDAALWAIGLWFVRLRFPDLARAVNQQLDPDAVMYRIYGSTMSLFSPYGFFSGRFSEREPLYVFVAHLVFKTIGLSELHIRYASLICSLPIPFLTYAMARRAGARRIASLVAASIVTMGSPYLWQLPSRGLRDDLFMTTSAAFIVAALAALQSQSNWRWIVVAAAGILCMWTRAQALLFACTFLGWLWIEGALHRQSLDLLGWARRWRIWEAALCAVVIYLSFVPIRMSWKRIYGYSDSAERGYARIIANTEFPDRAGTPGFPTQNELQMNPYSGPPITLRQYLFGMHTPSQLLIGTVRGTLKMLRDLMPDFPPAGRLVNRAGRIVLLLLLVGSFFFARSRIVTMAGWSSLTYAGYLYEKNLIEFRSVAHAMIPFTAAALVAADLLIRKLRERRAARLHQKPR